MQLVKSFRYLFMGQRYAYSGTVAIGRPPLGGIERNEMRRDWRLGVDPTEWVTRRHDRRNGGVVSSWKNNPRDYALELVESGVVDGHTLLVACLKFLSHDDVRAMLDANELSPRLIEPESNSVPDETPVGGVS